MRKSLSLGDLQNKRDKQHPWMADTFMDLPEGQDQEIPVTAFRLHSVSPLD